MGLELLITIVAGLSSLLAGKIVSSTRIGRLLGQLLGVKRKPEETYGERLAKLNANLNKASTEVDSVLEELAQVAKNRENTVKRLETDLRSLEQRENELKERIALLENVPIPVAEQFSKLLEIGDKRNARRDYVLFGAGVLVTTIIAVIIQSVAG